MLAFTGNYPPVLAIYSRERNSDRNFPFQRVDVVNLTTHSGRCVNVCKQRASILSARKRRERDGSIAVPRRVQQHRKLLPACRKSDASRNGAASRRTIVLLFGSFARSGCRVNKVCKEKRQWQSATVPLLIRSNYSRAKNVRFETLNSHANFSRRALTRKTVKDGIKRVF